MLKIIGIDCKPHCATASLQVVQSLSCLGECPHKETNGVCTMRETLVGILLHGWESVSGHGIEGTNWQTKETNRKIK